MSENTTPAPEDFNPEDVAAQAMADIMADSTKLLTGYLRIHAARITAERELEELARQEWAQWRALTSTKKGGFSEAQLRRQAIQPPAAMPRRDRGKKRATRATTKAPATAPTTEAIPEHGGQQYGG